MEQDIMIKDFNVSEKASPEDGSPLGKKERDTIRLMREQTDAFQPVEARQDGVRCEEIDCTAKHRKALHCSGRLALSGRIPFRESTFRQVGEGVSPTLDAGANVAGLAFSQETC